MLTAFPVLLLIILELVFFFPASVYKKSPKHLVQALGQDWETQK